MKQLQVAQQLQLVSYEDMSCFLFTERACTDTHAVYLPPLQPAEMFSSNSGYQAQLHSLIKLLQTVFISGRRTARQGWLELCEAVAQKL